MESGEEEIWSVVSELPVKAQKIWYRAFREALPEVRGDVKRAAAKAWKAFGRGGQGETGRDGSGPSKGQFGGEMRSYLELPDEVRPVEVKCWEESLRNPEGQNCGGESGLAGFQSTSAEEKGRTIEESVARGLLKPEQKAWAEAYATRDWEEFKFFLDLAWFSFRQGWDRGRPRGLFSR